MPTYSGDYVPGEGLDGEGDYNYCVINEEIFVKDAGVIHLAAHECFNGSKDIQILDARPHVISYGPPPGRTGFLGGHIPGSKNIFAQTIVNENGTLKHYDEL